MLAPQSTFGLRVFAIPLYGTITKAGFRLPLSAVHIIMTFKTSQPTSVMFKDQYVTLDNSGKLEFSKSDFKGF